MTTVVISTPRGPTPVEAAWSEGGLAVHQDYCECGDHEPDDEPDHADGWSITHVRSGFAVAKELESAGKAIAVAEALLPCGDWSRPFVETVGDAALHDAAAEVLADYGRPLRSKRQRAAARRRGLARYAPVTS